MITKNTPRARKGLFLPLVLCVPMVLSGCLYEEPLDPYTPPGGGGGGGTTFIPQGTIHNTSCSSSCTNIQTASQCAGADVRYSNYVQNGQAGVDSATLAQLYQQYLDQADLANEFLNTFGCN